MAGVCPLFLCIILTRFPEPCCHLYNIYKKILSFSVPWGDRKSVGLEKRPPQGSARRLGPAAAGVYEALM